MALSPRLTASYPQTTYHLASPTHFLPFFVAFAGFDAPFTKAERFFFASMSLKRSKSVMFLRTSLAFNFFAHAVSDHFFMISSVPSAFFNVFSLAPRGIEALKSVRLRRRT